jgi:predicted RNA-binding Zn-ribbon protein involved in translation (DUF1610 family)
MPELSKEVRTYEVSYICDVCGKGELRATGVMLMSNPPRFPHRCNACGAEKIFGSKYPQITYGVGEAK